MGPFPRRLPAGPTLRHAAPPALVAAEIWKSSPRQESSPILISVPPNLPLHQDGICKFQWERCFISCSSEALMHDCFLNVPWSDTELTAAETAWRQPPRASTAKDRENGALRKRPLMEKVYCWCIHFGCPESKYHHDHGTGRAFKHSSLGLAACCKCIYLINLFMLNLGAFNFVQSQKSGSHTDRISCPRFYDHFSSVVSIRLYVHLKYNLTVYFRLISAPFCLMLLFPWKLLRCSEQRIFQNAFYWSWWLMWCALWHLLLPMVMVSHTNQGFLEQIEFPLQFSLVNISIFCAFHHK